MKNRKLQTIILSVVTLASIAVIIFIVTKLKDQGEFLVYKSDQYHFQLQYPKTWQIGKPIENVAVWFVAPSEGALDSFQESVNIIVQDLRKSPMSLSMYSEMAVKQMKAVFENNLEIVEKKPVRLSGLPAYKFNYYGKSNAGRTYEFLHVWTIKNDIAYQVSFTASSESFDDYLPVVQSMMKSFEVY